MQDGDLETTRTREHRKSRPDIVKKDPKKDQASLKKSQNSDSANNTEKSEDPLIAKLDHQNGVQILQNGSAKHNNNHDKK